MRIFMLRCGRPGSWPFAGMTILDVRELLLRYLLAGVGTRFGRWTVGKYPVYQSPKLDEVEKKMRPSDDFRHGFLGTDKRKLIQIITDDQDTLNFLGLTHEIIAQRLRSIIEQAEKALGGPLTVEDKYIVEMHVARGKIPCPWAEPGLFRKSRIVLKRIDTGEMLIWSDLSIHLIEEHGFYQGEGSPYRLDPHRAKRLLEL